ncbi:hypothetical protein HanPI659440_Chr06g0234531 [Helianthus annuus]|nr:hypothetical protein HanPI659440_Chr06g0234531 [Helianthus annuus]
MIKLWNELLDHVRIGANLGTINPFKDHGTGVDLSGTDEPHSRSLCGHLECFCVPVEVNRHLNRLPG